MCSRIAILYNMSFEQLFVTFWTGIVFGDTLCLPNFEAKFSERSPCSWQLTIISFFMPPGMKKQDFAASF